MITCHDLASMKNGWFLGPFTPTLFSTSGFECAVKRYSAGTREQRHMHRIATEFTVIAEGQAKINGVVYGRDSIIEIPPGDFAEFEALTDVITFVVKTPAVPNDKFIE